MASNWRDYAKELTAEQITDLEEWERDPHRPDGRLRAAEIMAASNALQLLHRDVPAPPDAAEVEEWISHGDGEPAERMFTSSYYREDEDQSIKIYGYQRSDGSVNRKIAIDAGSVFTSAEARVLARMLLDAADEIDQLGTTRAGQLGPTSVASERSTGLTPWKGFARDTADQDPHIGRYAAAAAPALADAYVDLIADYVPGFVDELLNADRTVTGWQRWAYWVHMNRLLSAYREMMNRILPELVPLSVACDAYATIERTALRALRPLVGRLVAAADGQDPYSPVVVPGADPSDRDELIALAQWIAEDQTPLLQERIRGY
jgi:hypothetical protein